mmetsp:Transcript_39821/g.74277  ORF Transcript_39821/g.74277 Transcript_39821/m.74277 type:complete len:98 (-) Transcript_39821:8-301(-)
MAAYQGEVETVRLLLSEGATLTAEDAEYDFAALTIAAENGNWAAVKLMLDWLHRSQKRQKRIEQLRLTLAQTNVCGHIGVAGVFRAAASAKGGCWIL